MINIIKTGIITIIISFISGLLLDYYKNLAPRILCNVGKGIPVEINNKRIKAYAITVKNISKKTIHEISLHVQSSKNNLQIADAKITKGLKFESSIKNDTLDVNIPFLSKDDEFSVTVYVEKQYGVQNKPVVIIRSPEKFKEVNSVEKKGVFSVFTNIPKNIKEIMEKDETINEENREIINEDNKLGKNKKVIIVAASVALVVIVGVVARFYFKGKPADTNTKTPSVETKVPKQSNDSKGSTDKTTKGTDGKTKNTDGNSSTGGTTNNTDKKPSTGGINGNTNKKPSTGDTSGDTNKKPSTGGTSGDTNKKPSTGGGTTGNTEEKPSTGGTTGNTEEKPSTDGGKTGGTEEKPSNSETTGNTGN